ncbi:MAG: amidase [Alphaproteobacteria bacterium]
MNSPAPMGASAADLAAAIRGGTLSPVSMVEEVLGRIDDLNHDIKAYITVARDHALEAARRIEASTVKTGLLCGVPYACKDLFQSSGVRTTGGSRVLEGWIPEADAAAIERLTSSGAIMLGKANLHEFAHGITGENASFGTPPNPWDASRLTGGSSSGSAVAVANGLACFSIGSDTGGSIRVPAALCGLVGLKPTFGWISRYGMIPYCWSLDHVGIITKTAAEAALVLQVLAGYDPRDPGSVEMPVPDFRTRMDRGIAGLRIGVPEKHFFDRADPEIVAAVRQCLSSLGDHGVRLIPVEMPDMAMARTVSLLVQMPEVLSYHRRYLPEMLELYGEDMRAGLAFGQFILAEHYVRGLRMIARYRCEMAAVFESVDALITPTCPIIAPKRGVDTVEITGVVESVGDALARFTGFFNMTGNPAISVPSGLHTLGLPMGVQIIGRPFDDGTVLAIAREIENARGIGFNGGFGTQPTETGP